MVGVNPIHGLNTKFKDFNSTDEQKKFKATNEILRTISALTHTHLSSSDSTDLGELKNNLTQLKDVLTQGCQLEIEIESLIGIIDDISSPPARPEKPLKVVVTQAFEEIGFKKNAFDDNDEVEKVTLKRKKPIKDIPIEDRFWNFEAYVYAPASDPSESKNFPPEIMGGEKTEIKPKNKIDEILQKAGETATCIIKGAPAGQLVRNLLNGITKK